jgi:hypothetical protein
MSYTIKQHVLSQWWLRYFRSDETAMSDNDKKRVWCHTVYTDGNGSNVLKDIALPISSVAIKKDCFSLIDGDTSEKFDIKNEISIFEKRSAILVYNLVINNSFEKLLDVNCEKYPLDSLLNLMVIQMLLNLHNPQNKYEEKDDFYNDLIVNMIEDFDSLKEIINNPPKEFEDIFKLDIYQTIIRAVNSQSSKEEICSVLFVLFLIVASEGMPTLNDFLSLFKIELFKGI